MIWVSFKSSRTLKKINSAKFFSKFTPETLTKVFVELSLIFSVIYHWKSCYNIAVFVAMLLISTISKSGFQQRKNVQSLTAIVRA